jgi:hypothetical protein
MLFYNSIINTMMIDFFKADPLNKSRVEDALIAWTWKEYIDTNGTDPKILLRFPMTKVDRIVHF